MQFLLEHPVTGAVNLTAPHPENNARVIRELARAFHRPSFIPAPSFALRLAIGGFAEEILRPQRVVPTRLLEADFTFTYPDIVSAAQALTP